MNPGAKIHKKTKSSYVAAVAQTANSHGIGAPKTYVPNSNLFNSNDAF